jgi:hypothetical protein
MQESFNLAKNDVLRLRRAPLLRFGRLVRPLRVKELSLKLMPIQHLTREERLDKVIILLSSVPAKC